MKKETTSKEGKQEEPQEGSFLLNIGKIIFLIGALAAAWFILEKLIGNN